MNEKFLRIDVDHIQSIKMEITNKKTPGQNEFHFIGPPSLFQKLFPNLYDKFTEED